MVDDCEAEEDTVPVVESSRLEAVAMLTVTRGRATLLVPLVAGALFCTGCASGTVGSTAGSSPAAAPTVTPTPTPTPTSAARAPLTGRELRWLQAVEQLDSKMEKVFRDSPRYLTPRALRSLAYKVRGCSRELARLGSPTARLQPVEALVRQACREYDKGAKCFEDAARLGIPDQSQLRKLDQRIDCGFAASLTGGEPLAEAQNKADEVRRAAAAGSG
jgi:hypothetical protein